MNASLIWIPIVIALYVLLEAIDWVLVNIFHVK